MRHYHGLLPLTHCSLDRLLIILIDAYFPFYEDLSPNAPRPDPHLQQQLFSGLHRWETDCIRPCPLDKVEPRHQHLFGADIFAVFPPRRRTGASSVSHCGRSSRGRETCTCHYFHATGKRCLHLWAMVSFELLGPVLDFEENMAVIESHLKKLRANPDSDPDNAASSSSDEEEDDREDFAQYWGKPVENAEDLNDPDPRFFPSRPSAADDPDSEVYESSVSGDEDADQINDPPERSSPISRRYRPPKSPIAIPDVFDADSKTQSAPGAPSKIRPLNPGRAKKERAAAPAAPAAVPLPVSAANATIPPARPSKIRLPEVVKDHIDTYLRPAGITNTGNDCYIIAIIQVLAHLDTWRDTCLTVQEEIGLVGGVGWWGGTQPPNEVYTLLQEIQTSLAGGSLRAFPNLRTVMHGKPHWTYIFWLTSSAAGLIDSSTAMGDAAEFYGNLLTYLDAQIDFDPDRRFFTRNMLCGFVHYQSHEADGEHTHEGHHLPAVLVHPAQNPTATLIQMAEQSIEADCVTFFCDHDPPHTPVVIRNAVYYCNMFVIQVVWPARMEQKDGTSRTRVHVDRVFAIPERFQYGTDLRPWRLKGIICRIGDDPSTGHYIAIILHEEVYWVMDDHRVRRARGVGREAFASGRYPVMVFYERSNANYVPVSRATSCISWLRLADTRGHAGNSWGSGHGLAQFWRAERTPECACSVKHCWGFSIRPFRISARNHTSSAGSCSTSIGTPRGIGTHGGSVTTNYRRRSSAGGRCCWRASSSSFLALGTRSCFRSLQPQCCDRCARRQRVRRRFATYSYRHTGQLWRLAVNFRTDRDRTPSKCRCGPRSHGRSCNTNTPSSISWY